MTKEEWLWYFAYTDGHGSFGSGSNDDEYGATHFESYTYEPTGIHVEWDGKGSISLSANEMVRIQLRLNGYEYLYAYVLVADPAEYYTYEIQNGKRRLQDIIKTFCAAKC